MGGRLSRLLACCRRLLRITLLVTSDTYDAVDNTRIAITASNGLLANDVDADDRPPNPPLKDNLTVTGFDAVSANGGVVHVQDGGSFTCDPLAGFEGGDTFTYAV